MRDYAQGQAPEDRETDLSPRGEKERHCWHSDSGTHNRQTRCSEDSSSEERRSSTCAGCIDGNTAVALGSLHAQRKNSRGRNCDYRDLRAVVKRSIREITPS